MKIDAAESARLRRRAFRGGSSSVAFPQPSLVTNGSRRVCAYALRSATHWRSEPSEPASLNSSPRMFKRCASAGVHASYEVSFTSHSANDSASCGRQHKDVSMIGSMRMCHFAKRSTFIPIVQSMPPSATVKMSSMSCPRSWGLSGESVPEASCTGGSTVAARGERLPKLYYVDERDPQHSKRRTCAAMLCLRAAHMFAG